MVETSMDTWTKIEKDELGNVHKEDYVRVWVNFFGMWIMVSMDKIQ